MRYSRYRRGIPEYMRPDVFNQDFSLKEDYSLKTASSFLDKKTYILSSIILLLLLRKTNN